MNTIDFLLSLKDTSKYFKTINSDLEMLIECFSPTMFDNNFTEYSFKGDTFLKELEEDFKTISLEKVKVLADIVLEYKNFNNKDCPLLDTLRKGIKNYIIKYPKDLDINIYYPILVASVVKDLEKDLVYKINLSFNDLGKRAKARVKEDYHYNHVLEFPDKIKYTNQSYGIYDIYMTLYHEEYHMLVDEMGLNPYCYKIDILKYQIVKNIRNGLGARIGKELYQFYYDTNKEEMNANLYGMAKAKEKILEINPYFKVSYVYQNIEKPYYDSGSVNNVLKTFAKETREDYYENLLDVVAFKNPAVIEGMLTRMYNTDGTRKDYPTLKKELYLAVRDDSKNKDIYDFYAYLIVRYIRKLKKEEIESLIKEEEDYRLLFSVIIRYENLLQRDLENLNSTKLYYLSGNLRKFTTNRLILKELIKMDNIKRVLDKRKELGYGR